MSPINVESPKQRYHTTLSSVWKCDYHIIWCTKYRRPVLTAPIQERLKQLVLQKQSEYDYVVHAIEVMENHVHLVASVPPQELVSLVVGRIKGFCSRVLRDEFPELNTRLPCLWTRSKFVSSTGGVTLEVLKRYVEHQKGK